MNSHGSRLCLLVGSLKHCKKKNFSIHKRYRLCNWLKGIYLLRDDNAPHSYLCSRYTLCNKNWVSKIFYTLHQNWYRHRAIIIIHTIHKFPICMYGFPMPSIHHNYLHDIYYPQSSTCTGKNWIKAHQVTDLKK